MVMTDFFAGVPAADYDVLKTWYEQLFGRPPDFHPRPDEAVWNVADSAWVYVVAEPDTERTGRALMTLLVDDIDATVEALGERGVATDPVEDVPGKVRRTMVVDPEGNRVQLGEATREPSGS